MKIMYVFLGILLVASAAQAQIPVYPYLYTQPYLYSQPYAYTAGVPFSQPYVGPYYFLSPFSAAAQYAAQYSDQLNVVPQVNVVPNVLTTPATDNLTSQVTQLQSEVRRLQDELASVQAQAQTPPSRVTTTSTAQPKPVALVFKNGQRIESRGYAIAGRTVWYLTPFGYERVDLSNLNVAATQNENSRRGIEFRTTE
jgi:hypothetical protein